MSSAVLKPLVKVIPLLALAHAVLRRGALLFDYPVSHAHSTAQALGYKVPKLRE